MRDGDVRIEVYYGSKMNLKMYRKSGRVRVSESLSRQRAGNCDISLLPPIAGRISYIFRIHIQTIYRATVSLFSRQPTPNLYTSPPGAAATMFNLI